jgi:hypothetical protein
MLRALLVQLIRSDAIDSEDILEAADQLERDGDEDAAHALRCIPIAADAPSQSDWKAEQHRNRFRVIGPD